MNSSSAADGRYRGSGGASPGWWTGRTCAPPRTNSANNGAGTTPPPLIRAAGGFTDGASGSGSGASASISGVSHVMAAARAHQTSANRAGQSTPKPRRPRAQRHGLPAHQHRHRPGSRGSRTRTPAARHRRPVHPARRRGAEQWSADRPRTPRAPYQPPIQQGGVGWHIAGPTGPM